MADDHYTRLHNIAVRGGLPTQYVGVFGYIASHTEGWRLTQEQVARDLNVGVAFIRSALKAIEAAGCLIRTRERTAEGTLGGALWFITDLPMQLQGLGITDETLINERVRAAYDSWLADSPTYENHTLAATSKNAGRSQRSPRSGPKCDKPTLAEPHEADRTPKKIKDPKKPREKKTSKNSGSGPNGPADVRHAHARDDAARAENQDDSSADTHPSASPSPAAWRVLAALPREWRDCPAWVRKRLASQIDAAMLDRWTVGGAHNRIQTRHGAQPDAIVNAVARYGRGLAESTSTHPERHTEALSAVLAALAGDLAAGACSECGHHHGQDQAEGCSCCGRRHLAVVREPRQDPPTSAGLVAGEAGRCDVCDRVDPTATVVGDLPLPMSICADCRAAEGPDRETSEKASSAVTGGLTGVTA